MWILALQLFPTSGLDHSLFPSLLIGLFLMVLFNEFFGWPLSGMVIAGYLAPIFLISPLMGTLVLAEAFFTYFLYILLSEKGSRLGLWDRFFGRERFFVFLVLGIAVRFFLEGLVGPYLESQKMGSAHYLISVGTILIPLMANAFWQSGFRKAWWPLLITLGFTYLLLRLILIPYTNFSLQSFQASFEQFALDLDSSVKMYLVLLSTAYLASNNNLKWGWDYGGLIIPALLALAWFSPWRIVLTCLEVTIVFGMAKLFFPLVSRMTLEGGRRILYVFSLDFLYKVLVGFFLGNSQTEGLDALYGFGYLIPSLIVLKIWNKGYFFTLRIILQTSLTGAIVGSLLAWMLGFFLFTPEPLPKQKRLQKYLVWSEMLSPSSEKIVAVKPPSAKERDAFEQAMTLIYQTQTRKDLHILKRASTYAFLAGFTPILNRNYFYLKEAFQENPKGFGSFVFDLRPQNSLILEVFNPQDSSLGSMIPYLISQFQPQGVFLGKGEYARKSSSYEDTVAEHFRTNPYALSLMARKQFQFSTYLRISLEDILRPRLLFLKGDRLSFPMETLLKLWPNLEIRESRSEHKADDLILKYSQQLAILELPKQNPLGEQSIVPIFIVKPISGLVDRFSDRLQKSYLKNPLVLEGEVLEDLRLSIFKPFYQFLEEFPACYEQWKQERQLIEEGNINPFSDEQIQQDFLYDIVGKRLFLPLNSIYCSARTFDIYLQIFYWREEYFLAFYQRGVRELFLFRLKQNNSAVLQISQLEKNPQLIYPALQTFFNSSCAALMMTGGSFQNNCHYHFLKQYLNNQNFITLQLQKGETTILRTSQSEALLSMIQPGIPVEIQIEPSKKRSTLLLGTTFLEHYQSHQFLWSELKPFLEKMGYFCLEEDSDKFVRKLMLESQESSDLPIVERSTQEAFDLFKNNPSSASFQNILQLLTQIRSIADTKKWVLGALYEPITGQIAIFVGGSPKSYLFRLMAQNTKAQSELSWPESQGGEIQKFLEQRQFCFILEREKKKD
ncbi:MAG: poly-gamma-glutamate biosynthesis protein PgsC/CapC [Planctomycetota bacterium]